MSDVLIERLDKLDSFIGVLVQRYENYRKEKELKEELVLEVLGSPYYWHEWSGVLEKSSKSTEIVAHIIHKKTKEECRWYFDIFNVIEQIKISSLYSSWEDYYKEFVKTQEEEFVTFLKKYNYTEEQIEEQIMISRSKRPLY